MTEPVQNDDQYQGSQHSLAALYTYAMSNAPALVLIGIFVVFVALGLRYSYTNSQSKIAADPVETPTPTLEPTPTPIATFVQPAVEYQDAYEIALLGDSMTAALGPHGGPFSEYLHEVYDKPGFIVDNYAVGSSNIQSLQKRLNEPLEVDGSTYAPILTRGELDLIIVESFAYNPLSHLERELSYVEHERELKHLLEDVANSLPNTRVILMSTIAPSSDRYARFVQNLTTEQSRAQAQERIDVLNHHITLAGRWALPIINIYAYSRNSQGDGDLRYINPDDYIHPSVDGVELISRTMSEFIHQQRILPDAPSVQ